MSNKDIRFIGIDPSSKTGFVILDYDGNVVEAVEIEAENVTDPARIVELTKRVRKHLDPTTDKVLIEGFSYGSKGKAVDFQYGLGWTIRASLYINKIGYLDIPPKTLKKFVTGNGNSGKGAMVLPTYKKWGFEHKSDNVIDAYGLARIGWSMYHHENLTNYEKDVLSKLRKI